MGLLRPFCVTSDGTALWAIASAYPSASTGYNYQETYILLKSNDNPVDINVMTWSVVSTIRKKSLYSVATFSNTGLCIVDKGAFIFFTDSANDAEYSAGQQSFPGGIMYDPNLAPNPNANVTGAGGWKSVDGDYKWTSSPSILFPLKGPTGTTEVYHAYFGVSSSSRSSLSFGKFNPATTKFEIGPTWGSPYTSNEYIKSIGALTFSANNLYLLEISSPPSIVGIPFRNGSLPLAYLPRAEVEIHNATSLSSCISGNARTAVIGGNYILACENSTTIRTVPTQVPILASFSTSVPTSELTYQAQLTSKFGYGFSFVPVGDKAPWAFSMDYSDMYGLPLSGPEMGRWWRPTFKFNTTDGWGQSPITTSPGGGSSSASGGSTSGSAGAVVGGIFAAIIVVSAAVYFCCYRGAAKKAQLESQMLQQGQPGKTTVVVAGAQGQQDYLVRPPDAPAFHQPQKMPFEQANAVPGQPYPGMIPYSQQPMQPPMSQPYMQQGPPQFQQQPQYQQHQFQFSSHPQPNFVTTVGDDGTVQPASASQPGAALPTWEPQPFVPPVPGSEMSMSPSPFVNASPSAANAAYSHSAGSTVVGSPFVAPAPSSPPVPNHSRPSPAMTPVHAPQERALPDLPREN